MNIIIMSLIIFVSISFLFIFFFMKKKKNNSIAIERMLIRDYGRKVNEITKSKRN